MRTTIIELRTDFNTKEQDDIMINIMRETARSVYASALLMADKRQPTIAFRSGDMFESEVDLAVITPEDLA